MLKLMSMLIATFSILLFATSAMVQAAGTPNIHSSTRANLLHAMQGEAFAFAQYHAYAEGARQSGQKNLALLWDTIGDVEFYDHFVTEAGLFGLVGKNADNVRQAIKAEQNAIVTYKKDAMHAQEQHCPKVAEAFTEFAKDEATHEALFTAALKALQGKGQVPPPPAVHPVTIHRSTPACSSRQVQADLTAAEFDEAFARASYTMFASQAANTGQSKLAELFAGIALVELQEHFAESANLSGLVRSNTDNLCASITAETDAVKMYSRFAQEADNVGDHTVAMTFREIRDDEAGHIQSFKQALAGLNR
jgi:rubrerythrin